MSRIHTTSLNATQYRTISIDGVDIFYREAGMRDKPALLLLHGFPTSSHMFRSLIPALAKAVSCHCARLPGIWS